MGTHPTTGHQNLSFHIVLPITISSKLWLAINDNNYNNDSNDRNQKEILLSVF